MQHVLKQAFLVHCCALSLIIETFLFFFISRHNFQAGRNTRKATKGGAFIQTLPVKMTDYLGRRAVKSQFGTQAPLPPRLRPAAAFKCRPTNLQASQPLGCSKCIIIKIPLVAGLHCNFQAAGTGNPHRFSTFSTSRRCSQSTTGVPCKTRIPVQRPKNLAE